MLIKSNDFLQIQLAEEESLDAKLIPMDRGLVCVKQHNHTNIDTRLSRVAPQKRCCGSIWLKQFTALPILLHQGHEIRHFITWTLTLHLSLMLLS